MPKLLNKRNYLQDVTTWKRIPNIFIDNLKKELKINGVTVKFQQDGNETIVTYPLRMDIVEEAIQKVLGK